MNNASFIFIADDTNLEIEDVELDELFSHLEQIAPPTDMVARIMNMVFQQPLPRLAPASPFANLEKLVVTFDPSQLS